ncbi:MAG: hypothetical protein HKN44_02220 [Ilumatobacter sp.]|nr:hypothetical protein [Ilumatobacter sp.]
MTDGGVQQPTLSRRGLGALALGCAGAALLGRSLVAGDDVPPVRFDVVHDDSVYVTMTNGLEFVVEVRRRQGHDVLERFEGVTARSVLSLKSAWVTFADRT